MTTRQSELSIILKPWGQEEILEINPQYMVKRLTMNQGHRCSLQLHEFKIETVYLLSGSLRVYLPNNEQPENFVDLQPNDFLTIVPRQVHRMEGLETSVYLESSTPQMNDVVRIEDDYKRTDI